MWLLIAVAILLAFGFAVYAKRRRRGYWLEQPHIHQDAVDHAGASWYFDHAESLEHMSHMLACERQGLIAIERPSGRITAGTRSHWRKGTNEPYWRKRRSRGTAYQARADWAVASALKGHLEPGEEGTEPQHGQVA